MRLPRKAVHRSPAQVLKLSAPRFIYVSFLQVHVGVRQKIFRTPKFAIDHTEHSGPYRSHGSGSSFAFSGRRSGSALSRPSTERSSNRAAPAYPRIQIASLLTPSYSRSYHLEVVQQPLRTAEFGMANLSRLPLTPPLIVQLTVRDGSGNSTTVPDTEVPFLIAHLSLYSADGLSALDMSMARSHGHGAINTPSSQRLLYGNLVSTANILEDLQGNQGLFFLFPDVSIRWRGRFQLGISLINIARNGSTTDTGAIIAETRSRAFDVVRHEEYSAAPVTRLTQCFIRQGARISTYMNTLH